MAGCELVHEVPLGLGGERVQEKFMTMTEKNRASAVLGEGSTEGLSSTGDTDRPPVSQRTRSAACAAMLQSREEREGREVPPDEVMSEEPDKCVMEGQRVYGAIIDHVSETSSEEHGGGVRMKLEDDRPTSVGKEQRRLTMGIRPADNGTSAAPWARGDKGVADSLAYPHTKSVGRATRQQQREEREVSEELGGDSMSEEIETQPYSAESAREGRRVYGAVFSATTASVMRASRQQQSTRTSGNWVPS
eukprot:2718949-Rhodomonas_salina.1